MAIGKTGKLMNIWLDWITLNEIIAQKKKVYVTRTFYDSSGKSKDTQTYEVNVDALSTGSLGKSSPQRFWIYPGDRIDVPERLI